MDRWLAGMGEGRWEGLLVLWGMRAVFAVVLLLLGLWIARIVANTLQRAFERGGMDSMLGGFLRNIVYAVLVLVVLVMTLGTLGVHTASLLAVLGAAGLAVGLALQGSLSNIAAGIMLITLRPFRSGDYVAIAGQEGTVEKVEIFQTVLRSPNNHLVTLPNSQITSAPIVNYTARERRRADIAVGIGYEQDVARAREVLQRIAAEQPGVLNDPAPDVLVAGLGDSSVNLLLRAWIETPRFIAVRSALTEAVHREFARAEISIPFPQRDLHLRVPDALWDGVRRRLRQDGNPVS